MTDQNTPDSKPVNAINTPEGADKKGQMLVIYLPEGSVIVDRTDMGLSTAPQAVIEKSIPKAEEVPAEPIVEKATLQPLQPTLQEVVQLAVQEVLQITGHAKAPTPIVETPVAETPRVVEKSADAFADYPAPAPKIATQASPTAAAPIYRGARRVYVRRRRKMNWVHGINTFLVAYILLAAIVPAVLSSAFGTALNASKVAHPGALIATGDLLVSREVPAANLKVNDVLLVRDGNSWRLDARQVTSNVTSGSVSTITTASTGGAAIDKTYVQPNNSITYVVSRVIPKLGYIPIVLSSTIVKVLGGLFILVLNLVVHYRRSRKRRLITAVR